MTPVSYPGEPDSRYDSPEMLRRLASLLPFAVLVGGQACSQALAPSTRTTEPVASAKTADSSDVECRVDADCVCGVDRKTDLCAIGPIERVDPTRQCPDACGGPTGMMVQACESGRCKNVYRPRPARS